MTYPNAKSGERNPALAVQSCLAPLGSWLQCTLLSPLSKCLAQPPCLVCVVAEMERGRLKVELEGNFHGGKVVFPSMYVASNKVNIVVLI